MQITTATRTVEIYANTEAGVTYRNTKDGVAYGPVRTANRATAKAGSVGREILDAIDAITAEEEAAERAAAPAEVVATITETVAEGSEVEVAGRKGRVTRVVTADQAWSGRGWVAVTWTTTEAGAPSPSYGFAYLDQVTVAQAGAAERAALIRRAVSLKW